MNDPGDEDRGVPVVSLEWPRSRNPRVEWHTGKVHHGWIDAHDDHDIGDEDRGESDEARRWIRLAWWLRLDTHTNVPLQGIR